jgi:hypothetical protein
MANYTLSSSFNNKDQQDMTLIRLGNPLIANTKQLSAAPGGGTLQEKATTALRQQIIKKMKPNKTYLPTSGGQSEYGGLN